MSHHWGPPPGDPKCQAPAAVLSRYGFGAHRDRRLEDGGPGDCRASLE
jgi:hypothetical protein